MISFTSITVIATVNAGHPLTHLAKRTLIALSTTSLSLALYADRLGATDGVTNARNNALRRAANTRGTTLIIGATARFGVHAGCAGNPNQTQSQKRPQTA